MAQCKDCRFYEKSRCSETSCGVGPTYSACYRFSAYSGRSDVDFKQCKNCRFYSSGKCTERNAGVGPTYSKCVYGSVCK